MAGRIEPAIISLMIKRAREIVQIQRLGVFSRKLCLGHGKPRKENYREEADSLHTLQTLERRSRVSAFVKLSPSRALLAASAPLLLVAFANAQSEKLSSTTIALARAFAPSRDIGEQQNKRIVAQRRRIYNISGPDDDPIVSLIITTSMPAALSNFNMPGVVAQYKSGHRAFVRAKLSSLDRLSKVRDAVDIVPDSVKIAPRFHSDADIAPARPTISSRDLTAANPVAFDAQGFTGKGVAVGIVDSGIDWHHPDFINEDGTSRIVAIWDLTDTSFKDGKGGSKPPVEGMGTLYTNDQINDALKGNSTIATTDTFGHGTACAGIAAGNGRGKLSGVAAGYYKGVAPEADLIIARVGIDGSYTNTEMASAWVADIAASRKEPLSLSLSFGSSYSGHSGADDTEKIYADMAGAGKAGIAVAVAAGNDGAHGAHAGGKISASIQGAASHDFHAKALFETDGTAIAVFNKHDDWALDLTADEVLGTSPSKEFTAHGKR